MEHDLLVRVDEYVSQRRLSLMERLGGGIQGVVFTAKSHVTDGESAVKVHRREADYLRERDAYLRLDDCGVTRICDCHVPQLIGYDDDLLVLEMTVVVRPFVLDFGGAFLDREPDFPPEVLDEWRAEKREQFGSRWSDVEAILATLARYGVYMVDVNPGNISFGD